MVPLLSHPIPHLAEGAWETEDEAQAAAAAGAVTGLLHGGAPDAAFAL